MSNQVYHYLNDFQRVLTPVSGPNATPPDKYETVFQGEDRRHRLKRFAETALKLVEFAEQNGWQSVPEHYKSIANNYEKVQQTVVANHKQFQSLLDQYKSHHGLV